MTCRNQQLLVKDALPALGNDVVMVSIDGDPNENAELLRRYADDLGFTWRFAPGLTFDWVYGILVAGSAYDTNRFATFTNAAAGQAGTFRRFDAENVYTTTARVRYTF